MIGPSAPEKGDCVKRLWLGATLAAVALVCARPAIAQIGIVAVTGGRVEGTLSDGVTSFKGIPFAAPPVGNLRWREPQPVQPWSGIKKAGHFGPSCMQNPMAARLYGALPALSEDCLYLNVWTGAKSAHERLPVMVWIYGGGDVTGSTSTPMFDGARLARKGVVLVSVAYRLGALGYLADPELSAESPHHVSGNYGLLDVIAALEWVKSNIGKFGGDPSRVTIFGQSAGGFTVGLLAVSPLAKGLFQRAISESGGIDDGAPDDSLALPAAEAIGKRFLAQMDAKTLTAARALAAEEIVNTQDRTARFEEVIDGYVLPENEYRLYQAGQFTDTPLLLGTNSDEGRMLVAPGAISPPENFGTAPAAGKGGSPAGIPAQFEAQIRAQFGSYAEAILALYPHATDAEAEQAARDVVRDSGLGFAAWAWASLHAQQGRSKVYLYYFDRHSPQAPFGPTHGAEQFYVFGNLAAPASGVPFALSGPRAPAVPESVKQAEAPFMYEPYYAEALNGTPGPTDVALSEQIQGYWVNFAKTGNPNGPGLPHWPAFSSSSQRVMYLDAHPHAGPVPNMRKLKTLDAYFARLREEAKKEQAH